MIKKKLVLIDDDKSFVKEKAAFLRETGFEVLTAHDGKSGLKLLQKEGTLDTVVWPSLEGSKLKHKGVDLVVLDLDLPKMNGDEVIENIKKDSSLWGIKVLVLSSLDAPLATAGEQQIVANARSEGRKRRGWDANFGFARKQDIRENRDLLKIINAMLSTDVPVDIARQDMEDWKILIVDDDKADRAAIAKRLADRVPSEDLPEPYAVLEAENGREALEILGGRPVDLVVLDLDMPDTDGYQVLEIMKSNFVLSNIPVIVNTKLKDIDAAASAEPLVRKGGGFNGMLKMVDMDDASRVAELAEKLLRTRREMGYGYLRKPVTFFRNARGEWMKGPLEYYSESRCRETSARCSHCGGETAVDARVYEYNPSRMFPSKSEKLKVRQGGDIVCEPCARDIVKRYPDKWGAYAPEDRELVRSAETDRAQREKKTDMKRVLIVDDNVALVSNRKNGLEEMGYIVFTAYDGRQGLDVLQNEKIDLVVLDLDMPRMNGLEVLQIMKKDPKLKDIRVMVYTTLTESQNRLGLYAAPQEQPAEPVDAYQRKLGDRLVPGAKKEGIKARGWDHRFVFVQKGDTYADRGFYLQVNELFVDLTSLDRHRADDEPCRVLVVDDNDKMRQDVVRALDRLNAGYEFYEAENGQKALEILANRPVDLIVLDIDMPMTTGDEVIKIVKSTPILHDIPIIVATGIKAWEDKSGNLDKDIDEIFRIRKEPIIWFMVAKDAAGQIAKVAPRLLKQREEMGYGYVKDPLTFIRNNGGAWLPGALEYYKKASIYGYRSLVEDGCTCNVCAEKLRGASIGRDTIRRIFGDENGSWKQYFVNPDGQPLEFHASVGARVNQIPVGAVTEGSDNFRLIQLWGEKIKQQMPYEYNPSSFFFYSRYKTKIVKGIICSNCAERIGRKHPGRLGLYADADESAQRLYEEKMMLLKEPARQYAFSNQTGLIVDLWRLLTECRYFSGDYQETPAAVAASPAFVTEMFEKVSEKYGVTFNASDKDKAWKHETMESLMKFFMEQIGASSHPRGAAAETPSAE